MTPGDPRPGPSLRPSPQKTVALVNLGLLALVAALTGAYWLVSGTIVPWPTLAMAIWAGIVQFALRRRPDPRVRRRRRLRLENALIGTFSVLALVAAVVIPLSKLLPF